MTRLSAIVLFAVIVLNVPAASAQTPLGSAEDFAVLAGAAVTCTNSTVTGDVGALGTVTQVECTVEGTVHEGDAVARRAFIDFMRAYNNLEANPPVCDATLTGTLANQVLDPGVYCLDATAKTGKLTLDAGGDENAVWLFLVNGALTGTNFNVVMINGGQACNVDWWVRAAATLTDSNFLGTILAGAAITVTRGSFSGHALATAAVTLTDTTVSVCKSRRGDDDDEDECKDHHGNCKCKCRCKKHHDGDDDGHHGDKDHKDRDCDGHHHDGDKDHDKDQKDRDHGKDGKDGKDNNGKDRNPKGNGSRGKN